jgi:hypothetical protein
VQGAYCNACGCPLSAKVRSNDICPEHKWQWPDMKPYKTLATIL